MPATIASLRAKIELDGAEKAKRDLKEIKGSGGGSGSGILGLADSFKTGLGAISGFFAGFAAVNVATDALGFLKDQMGDVMQQAMDQQKVQAQTNAVIKSTGGAAHFGAEEVGNLADSLARATGISDDTVQSATNLLLTFTKLNGDILPQATSLVLDLATAMHEDTQSAALQLGKALNDPIQGVQALRRVGVQLSQQQDDAVRHFMAVGDIASAQKVILGELTKEVGGSAAAYGQTVPGQIARFNVALDQAKEKIGSAVLPVLSDLMEKYLLPLADNLGRILPGAIQATTDFFTNTLEPAIAAFMATPLGETLQSWADSLVKNVNPAVDSGTGLSGATNNATGSMKSLQDQAGKTGSALDPNYTKSLKNTVTETNNVTDAIDPKGAGDKSSHALAPAMRRADDELAKLGKAQKQANQSSQGSIPVLSGLGEAFGNLFEKIGEAAGGLGQFKDDVERRFPGAEPVIHQVLNQIGDDFSGALDGIRGVWDNFWGILSFPVRLAFDLLHGLVNVSLDLLGKDAGQAEYDWGKTWDQMGIDVQDFGKSLGGIVQSIGGTILNLFLAPIKGLWPAAQPILGQFEINVITWLKQNAGWWPGVNDLKYPILPGNGQAGPGYGKKAAGGPASGLTLVGEMGPELLQLPPNSYVYNNTQTRAMLAQPTAQSRQPGIAIYVNGADQNSALQIAREVEARLRRRDLLAGMYS